MRVRLSPINPTIGDIAGNAELIAREIEAASAAGADAVVLPELAICGYPPRDLILAEGFVDACSEAVDRIAGLMPEGITAIIGKPIAGDGMPGVGNGLAVIRRGARVASYRKRLLPTYDVFDEDRYFVPGDRSCVIDIAGTRVGLAICEDLWRGEDAGFAARYRGAPDPVAELIRDGARAVISPSASPFVLGKRDRHQAIMSTHATRHGVIVASVNQLGGNDDLVFDGHAMVVTPFGRLAAAGPLFEADGGCTFDSGKLDTGVVEPEQGMMRSLFDALVLGVCDYARKTGFSSALLGLSGGIDSALTAVIASAAIGPALVTGVAMPGPYSSDHALADAREIASRLGIRFLVAPIGEAMDGARRSVDGAFNDLGAARLGASLPDLAEENLQSRLRGTTLMAISNRTGALLLTTGNKSELAVGYCTLYGDMNGGLAVISDLSKQQVYALARWINASHAQCGFASPPIPERSIAKAPSAELRPNQTDQDSLPPYEVLDTILEGLVERREAPERVARECGVDLALVERVRRMVEVSEYKRRQAAPGLKVTSLAFGTGRRMPIAQGWRRASS